jgi:sirohydrochlorin ferrochelatase
MRGLLLIDHGSRRSDSNRQLEDMAQRLQRLRPDDAVACAHMELGEPTIEQAFAQLAARKVAHVDVLLYFLSDGRHSREDIPNLVKAAAARHPGMTFRIGPALGPTDDLAAMLLKRADIA